MNFLSVGDYYVTVDTRPTAWGEVTHLEISRVDNQPIHIWHDLQRIKDHVCGASAVAVEIYPAAERLVDAQHAYHLWVLPRGFCIPFGIHEKDNEN